MTHSDKMKLISLFFGFILLLSLPGKFSYGGENEILHLRYNDFLSFVKHYNYAGIENVYEEREVETWSCDFVCWKDRKIIIPNNHHTEQIIPMSLWWDLQRYQQSHPSRGSVLVTQNRMQIITLKSLQNSIDYHAYISRVKRKCGSIEKERNIEFFIFDFNNSGGKMKIHYCLDSLPQNCLLPAASEVEENCIQQWKERFLAPENDERRLKKFSMEIKFLKCDWNNAEDNRREYNRIVFCNHRAKSPCRGFRKDVKNGYSNKQNSTLNIFLEFSFETSNYGDDFFKMINEPGIWLENVGDVRLASTSLYANLIRSSDNISGNPFKFYFAHTRNFSPGQFDLQDDSRMGAEERKIRDIDLKKIENFVRTIIADGSRDVRIHLVGFADRSGNWKLRNTELARARAHSVKIELFRRLNDIVREEDITIEGCHPDYYLNNEDFKDRFVEVRIY